MTLNDQPPAGTGERRDAARKAWRFVWGVSGVLVALFALFAIATRFELFGAGVHVNFAIVLGVLGTILLGVGLMSLTFFSDRSGADDEVINLNADEWNDTNREP